MKITFIVPAIIVTIVAMAVCIITAGGGHGTYVPSIFTFPFTMMIATLMKTINSLAITLSFLQFPIYGLIIANCKTARTKALAIVSLFMLHCAAIVWTLENNHYMS